MNGAAIKILTAAAEAVGGRQKFAARLGIGPSLLARFISGRLETPDSVLLQSCWRAATRCSRPSFWLPRPILTKIYATHSAPNRRLTLRHLERAYRAIAKLRP